MKLLSHGPGSDLRQHLAEVMTAAEKPPERIICAGHDLGKATIPWQEYARRGFTGDSPHSHAASGGLLAALALRELGGPEAPFWALVALHVGAAHHSGLDWVQRHKDEFCLVASDAQAAAFWTDAVDGVASLLPEIPPEVFAAAWTGFRSLAALPDARVEEFNQWLTLPAEDRLSAFLTARSLLGRLCFQDHLSAAKQSGRQPEWTSWSAAYPDQVPFHPRPPHRFSAGDTPIYRLRRELKQQFHRCLEHDDRFYFIDAPTGLGKTETMLSAAEILQQKHHLQHVVFAVPQVSIADQIYTDYFPAADVHAQIWNYLCQEKRCESNPDTPNDSASFTLAAAAQPFSESYNITTFNQVLLAMCHPLRTRCIRGLGLRHAVIIMDEFHKLPLTILPCFFRLARRYAEVHDCRFIFGSATPLEEFDYLGLAGSGRIPPAITAPIYHDPAIDDRRHYRRLGPLTIDALADRIDSFQQRHPDAQNLLVVLNLIEKGTWLLLRRFLGSYHPWDQLRRLHDGGTSRVMIFLDGLVPPLLRRQIVMDCKDAMKRRPVTLITTQMVEVGVDLDFDDAMIDYQGLAATIQRGGRVGREGRDHACLVEVFSLLTLAGKTSFQTLIEIQNRNDLRMNDPRFADIARRLQQFQQREVNFFDHAWSADAELKDSDLIARLLEIQRRLFAGTPPADPFDRFFAMAMGGELGADFLSGQYLAELFTAEFGDDLLLLADNTERETLIALADRVERRLASAVELKAFHQFIADRKISVSPSLTEQLGLSEVLTLACADNLKCMMREAPIF